MQAEYELYVDVWFLTNFSMDAIALWSAARLLRQPVPLRRILLGSLVGTGGSMLLFFQMHDYLRYQLTVHLFLNPCMVWLCFHKPGISPSAAKSPDASKKVKMRAKTFLCQLAAAYLAMFLLGGFLGWAAPKGAGGLSGLLCLAGAAAAVEAAEKLFLHIRRQRGTLCGLLLVTREGKVPAKGFYDTGNLLVDPLLNRPVHIARKSLLWGQIQKEGLPLRLIPFHSLGEESGMIEAVTLEGMYILRDGHPVYLDKPVFGIADEKLFQDDRCDVILNGKSMEI